ncbi:MAG: hypothetical protein WED07_03455 [Candidatus Freyarchaeum deiterrae]
MLIEPVAILASATYRIRKAITQAITTYIAPLIIACVCGLLGMNGQYMNKVAHIGNTKNAMVPRRMMSRAIHFNTIANIYHIMNARTMDSTSVMSPAHGCLPILLFEGVNGRARTAIEINHTIQRMK